jgi:hypothetical protein
MGSTGSVPIFQVLNTADGYVRRQISNEERFTAVRKRVAKVRGSPTEPFLT